MSNYLYRKWKCSCPIISIESESVFPAEEGRVFSFAISQRSLEQIGISLAGSPAKYPIILSLLSAHMLVSYISYYPSYLFIFHFILSYLISLLLVALPKILSYFILFYPIWYLILFHLIHLIFPYLILSYLILSLSCW